MTSRDEQRSALRAHRTGARHPVPAPRAGAGSGAGPPIRIADPGELVAIVPALIGFHPCESLVLIATGGRSGRRIGLTVRVDLPPPEHTDLVVADAVRGLLLDDPNGAAVAVIGRREGGEGGEGGPPHSGLATAVVAALASHDVDVHTVIWAQSTCAGAPWACYDPCSCSGRLPDPASTVFAASVVAGGQVIHDDRGALERLVAPADPQRLRVREQLLVRALDEQVRRPGAATDPDEDPTQDPAVGLALVDAAIAACAEGGLDLDDEAVIDLARALSDPAVRDAALLRNVGPAAAAAEQLWTTLVREMPDPEAAEPAALLTVSALLRGDGALANVALERAQRAWPGHRLSRLLRLAADSGIRPAQVRGWLTGGRPELLRPAAGSG